MADHGDAGGIVTQGKVKETEYLQEAQDSMLSRSACFQGHRLLVHPQGKPYQQLKAVPLSSLTENVLSVNCKNALQQPGTANSHLKKVSVG